MKYHYTKFIKKNVKFQDTILGLIILGLVTSAIAFIIFPSKSIINSDLINGDKVGGDKIVYNQKKIEESSSIVNDVEEIFLKKEYFFANTNSFVQALVDSNGIVLVYSVTTRNHDYNPIIKLVNDVYSNDYYFYPLGKKTFFEISESYSGHIEYSGRRWNKGYYYIESYAGGSFKNEQSFIFSYNKNGARSVCDECDFSVFENFETHKFEHKYLRKTLLPNTITITAPFVDILGKITLGPEDEYCNIANGIEDIIRVIDVETFNNVLLSLYPGISIDNFIEKLGKPIFVKEINILILED